jgi:hypothetical protein
LAAPDRLPQTIRPHSPYGNSVAFYRFIKEHSSAFDGGLRKRPAKGRFGPFWPEFGAV